MDLRLHKELEALGFKIELKGEIWVVSDCFKSTSDDKETTNQPKYIRKKYYEKNNLQRRLKRQEGQPVPKKQGH